MGIGNVIGEIPFSMDSVVCMVDNGWYDRDGELLRKTEPDDKKSEYVCGLKRSRTGVRVRIRNGEVEERGLGGYYEIIANSNFFLVTPF